MVAPLESVIWELLLMAVIVASEPKLRLTPEPVAVALVLSVTVLPLMD